MKILNLLMKCSLSLFRRRNNIHLRASEVVSSFIHIKKESTALSRVNSIFLTRVKMALNYKSSLLMTLFLNLVTIMMYFFFSRINPEMQIFGINATYFEFAIIGLCLQMVVGTSLGTVSANIYNEIISGTWSSVLLHFNFIEYSIGTTLAGVMLSSISIFVAIGLAYLTIGFYLTITFQEVMILVLLFILIVLAHMSISMLFAAFTIFYQKTSNLISILYQLSKTFCGVVFPVTLLSGFPLLVSKSLPLTYGLETIHQLLFSPTLNKDYIYVNCLILIGFIVLLGSIAYGLVFLSLKNSRKNGKVDWY